MGAQLFWWSKLTMDEIPINHFDRGKPFYPLIILYLVQLAGVKEFAAAGLPGLERVVTFRSTEPTDGVAELSAEESGEIAAMLDKLLGPLRLRSQVQEEPIEATVEQLGQEVADAFEYHLAWTTQAAGSLLILAHEVTKDQPDRDGSPVWEFLRHCRNAAAHGGRFHFIGDEPRRPAHWHHLQITSGLQGVKLFKDASRDGLLEIGDPVRLLWDIEQANPGMVADPSWVGLPPGDG